ncbi:PD-(D/E)XK nuclease family protein [Butyrivibrio sp. VCD2006]|uniref:PD-(D/E)XK nuclease family protein n=1 Tax=Butyrivibrio sp. VCD2006 TaxID=1280664 RepID=UPI00041F1CB3|nr:PD-(D/E)XK nuclease family protein [Butyrivibrio sp. VCD2006]
MLRFVFGASGSGKSYRLREYIIERSCKEPERNFLIVVPDQFTMQTQMDIVKQHPDHGIMNIDVVSFSRLSHRIFEEVGESHEKVLDDMGKSLVLRHVAEENKSSLPVIGGSMHKMGYIDEVKSTISEFMQYGIEPGMLDDIMKVCENKGALRSKLLDLQLLYSEFKNYIKGNYIAQEELLDVLCRALPSSKLIADSVIAFDGFTGFTPIQYRVISEILRLTSEVIFSFSIGEEENPYLYDKNEEQDLFLLTKKTVHDLLRLEYDNEKNSGLVDVPDFERWAEYRNGHCDDVFLKAGEKGRHAANPELAFLEKHLFRYGNEHYGDTDLQKDKIGDADGNGESPKASCESIRILEADTINQEVQMTLSSIRKLLRENRELHYRDFAIVCGSMDRYATAISEEAEKYNIPIYLDQTGNVKLNPLVEAIRSALLTVISKYSYESVFHFLRSGLSPLSSGEADILENYVRALGIRGQKGWENEFTRLPKNLASRLKKSGDDEDNAVIEEEKKAYLDSLNDLRTRTIGALGPLFAAEGKTVLDYSKALYEFLMGLDAQAKMSEFERKFREQGDEIRAKEYSAIYRKVIALLDQVTGLMGNEKITWKEYADILDVGFSDFEIGTIPQSVDRIVVGDIERTRLKEVRTLFFLGVNDDLIPKAAGTGGIISDIERQYLADTLNGIELAPTPRQQMYIQRLYLYMNLTKPSDRLYLTFAHLDPSGKSIRPAYLIGKIRTLFPGAKIEHYDGRACGDVIQTPQNGIDYVASHLQEYALGYMNDEEERAFSGLFHALSGNRDRLARMIEAAGSGYVHRPLSEAVASALYGNFLVNSVSRLEKFAQCSYAHFLQYGLRLYEREEFDFDHSDMGTVFHGALEVFSRKLSENDLTWENFTKEQGEKIMEESLLEFVDGYNGNILESTKRNEYLMERIKRILFRTVDTLQYQLSKGSFVPKSVETSFDEVGDIDAINISLSEDEKGRILQKMKLTGSIDRIDTYEDENHVYIKIIDFKSGSKDFELCSLYYGLQLQLVMYMNVARGMAEATNKGKEAVPAAILYYHLSDPVLDGGDVSEDATGDDINALVRKALKTKGLIREDEGVAFLLDHDFAGGSDVVPLKLKSSGGFDKSKSKVMAPEDFEQVSEYVSRLIKKSGRSILQGNIEVNPYSMGSKDACTYCGFKSICGFEQAIPGYSCRQLPKLDKDEVLERINTELNA